MYRPPIPDLWRVPDALARIRALLTEHPEGGELSRFLPAIAADAPDRTLQARAAVASTLVAGIGIGARRGVVAPAGRGFWDSDDGVDRRSCTGWHEPGQLDRPIPRLTRIIERGKVYRRCRMSFQSPSCSQKSADDEADSKKEPVSPSRRSAI